MSCFRGQAAHRRKQREGCDDEVAPCDDQRLARVQQLLLRVEYVERRALADALLLLHAGERDLGSLDALVRGSDRAARRIHLRPGGDHGRAHLVAREVDLDLPEAVLLLRLPDPRRDQPALIERDGHASGDRRGVRITAELSRLSKCCTRPSTLTVGQHLSFDLLDHEGLRVGLMD